MWIQNLIRFTLFAYRFMKGVYTKVGRFPLIKFAFRIHPRIYWPESVDIFIRAFRAEAIDNRLLSALTSRRARWNPFRFRTKAFSREKIQAKSILLRLCKMRISFKANANSETFQLKLFSSIESHKIYYTKLMILDISYYS